MASDALLSCPAEILTLILASCDTVSEVLNLALTCKELYAAWKLNAGNILENLGTRCVPAFDEALVATRALEIVKTAIFDGKLPPKDINIAELTATFRKPQLLEMRGVSDLHRLVQFTEKHYLHFCPHCSEHGVTCAKHQEKESSVGPDNLPPPGEWEKTCRTPFHRAVYRVLLAGPVLAGWYVEPFASDGVANGLPPEAPNNLDRYLRQVEPEDEFPGFSDLIDLEEQDYVYLERFLPYDQDANTRISKKQDPLFFQLGTWLVQSMKQHITHADLEWAQDENLTRIRNRRVLNLSGFRGESTTEGVIILSEVMRMLVAYESLTRTMINFDNKTAHGRWGSESDPNPREIEISSTEKSLFAIILGVYHLEHIQFSKKGVSLVCTPIGRLPESFVDIFSLQEATYHRSGRINTIDGGEAAPAHMHLFAFLLRRFFNVQFQLGYLWSPDIYYEYLHFLSDGGIFNNSMRGRTDGTRILADFTPFPVFSFS